MLKRKTPIPQAIREAVDFCPGGLCFSMPDGRPIIVNRQMNRLAALITGHTVLDAEAFWSELGGSVFTGACTRLEKPWDLPGGSGGGQLCFAMADGSVWRFGRSALADEKQTYIQLEAADITELYGLSEELYANNMRLKALRGRQKALLANIVQINREKELLAVKMRVHDELGQCLLATAQALRGGTLSRDGAALAKGWEDAIRGLTNIPLEDAADASQEEELKRVAEMIGCRIEFSGKRPADSTARRLLYAAVREALTNAVRHAGADALMVSVSRSASGYRVEISDNGRGGAVLIREGDGLRNLRRRLEQEGAAMSFACENGAVMILDIPCRAEKTVGGEDNDEHPAG